MLGRTVLLTLVLLLSVAASAPDPLAEAGREPAIDNAGVNLFQHIDPATVEMVAECPDTRINREPITPDQMGQASFLETDDPSEDGHSMVHACGRFVIPLESPYPPDHIHLRMEWTRHVEPAIAGVVPDVTQEVRIVSPQGVRSAPYVEPDHGDLVWPQSWQQDPTDLFPLFMDRGDPSQGTIELVWQNNPGPRVEDFPVPLVSAHAKTSLRSSGMFHYDPDLYYVEQQSDFPWGDSMPMSHLEYSFVDVPGMRIHDEAHAGGTRTYFSFDVTPELLETFEVSMQADMLPGFQYVHTVLPDGSLETDWDFYRIDIDVPWATPHHIPKPLMEPLTGNMAQVTVTAAMIQMHGPGTYSIVVEEQGSSASWIAMTLPGFLAILLFAGGGIVGVETTRRWNATRRQLMRRGSLIAGRYRLGAIIGQGTEGPVHEAKDRQTGSRVAVKLVAGREDPRSLEALLKLKHLNLVQVLDLARVRNGHAVVMEYMDGGTLATFWPAAGMGLAEWRHLAEQLTQGLAVLHQAGVVHRDIKPANILLDKEGNAKIADYGLARATDADATIVTGLPQGTLAYMSPEQALGQPGGTAGDVYSLGAVLYEACTGVPHSAPRRDESAAEFHVRVSKGLEVAVDAVPDGPLRDFFATSLAPHPKDRYPDGVAMAAALAELFK